MIAIFASGSGSNALKIMAHFQMSNLNETFLICTDNPKAGIIEKATALGGEVRVFTKEEYQNGAFLTQYLNHKGVILIVLAGYLKLIPADLTTSYHERILNIHPALLPKFGGKGMYGMKAHQAVLDAKETHSGITIHYVDEVYDHGKIIVQEKVAIQPNWTAEDLQKAVQVLEHEFYPKVVAQIWKEIV